MISFTIPYPSGRAAMAAWNKRYSLNAYWSGKHYQARRRDAEEIHALTVLSMKRAGVPGEPVSGPVEVRFRWDDGLDADNHAALGKMIVDAMKGFVLPDDSRKWVRKVSHEFWDGKRILVEVREYEQPEVPCRGTGGSDKYRKQEVKKMERLTLKAGLGGKTGLCGMASTEFCFEQKDCYTCSHGKMCFDRLAAYEDTGLEPGEVITLKSIKSWADAVEHELEKYTQAEKDGRLVVLPCKTGDTFFQWKKGDNILSVSRFEGVAISEDGEITYPMTRWGEVFTLDDFGKTVFLTRAEAEAALERRKEGQHDD